MLNGVMLFGAESLRRRAPTPAPEHGDGDERIARTTGWRQALGIGAAQALALIPGFSRSGATMGGGLLAGLSNEDAARFSFLLATPIIGAAAALKLPDLIGSKGDGIRGPAALGALGAAVAAYLTVRFLMRFFETRSPDPVRGLLRHRRSNPVHLLRRCPDREVAVNKNRRLVIPAIVVGVVLIAIAIVYWVEHRRRAAVVLPRPRGRLLPPPRQARPRRLHPGPRRVRLRVVPDRTGGESHDVAPGHRLLPEVGGEIINWYWSDPDLATTNSRPPRP